MFISLRDSLANIFSRECLGCPPSRLRCTLARASRTQFNAAHGTQLRNLRVRGDFNSATPTCSERKRQALYARYVAAQEAIDNGSAFISSGMATTNIVRGLNPEKESASRNAEHSGSTVISMAALLEAGLADKRCVDEMPPHATHSIK